MGENQTTPITKSSLLTIPIAVIVAGALIAGAVLYAGRGDGDAAKTPNSPPAATSEITIRPVGATDHILGNPEARVFLIEYSDLECPFCKRFHPTVHQLMENYGKVGDLAWVYRQFPIESLHSQAPFESQATECVAELAGNDAFWRYVDKIFEVTPANNGLDLALLPQLAEEIGVDPARFKECQDSGRHQERIAEDIKDGIAAGLQGTPYSVFVTRDGRKFPVSGGAVSYQSLESILKEALKES